ncbi:integrase [Streptomyces canus]|uniref:integrase n=1 Tax=Streptomyces canus TaxID=58343 RepID=UPI0030E00044
MRKSASPRCASGCPPDSRSWYQRSLLHALREFEQFHNGHRRHQGIANAAPLRPLPAPIADPEKITRLDIRRHERLGGILHEYQHGA